jgi:N-acetylglucosaminyl-diphospho-decaprenol L-rhamnosyltransferase
VQNEFTVEVVVVSYNSRDRIRSCVRPLLEDSEIHVVVVDNASPDKSVEVLADLPITTIALESNLGFAAGCNAGWRATTAPYVLFLNPDATIEPAAVRRLTEVLEDDPRIGAVAPRIVDEDGSLDRSIRRFPRLTATFAQALFLHRLFPRVRSFSEVVTDDADYTRPGTVEWVSGACVLARRSALEELGGLDEGFFMYCEDKDLCRRLRDSGWRVCFEPQAECVHQGGHSAPRSSLLPVLAASRMRYARKHRSRIAASVEIAGIALGALTHALVSIQGRTTRAGHCRALRMILSGTAPVTPPAIVSRSARSAR